MHECKLPKAFANATIQCECKIIWIVVMLDTLQWCKLLRRERNEKEVITFVEAKDGTVLYYSNASPTIHQLGWKEYENV